MSQKTVPDENDIELMLQLEHELESKHALELTPEQRRGKEVTLRHIKAQFDLEAVARERLARLYDPDYKPNPQLDYGITKEERARRDEARRHLVNWSKLDRDRRDA